MFLHDAMGSSTIGGATVHRYGDATPATTEPVKNSAHPASCAGHCAGQRLSDATVPADVIDGRRMCE